MSVALVSAATATATALTVGVEPPPAPAKRIAAENVDLAAAISLLPTHDKVPDITGGLGTVVYDGNQAILDSLSRAIVNGIKFTALAQAAGIDPKSLVTKLLAGIPSDLLPSIIATLAFDVPVLQPVLKGLNLESLTGLLSALGLDEVTDNTLTALLAVIGYNVADPLNLAGLSVPGLNVITTGATFGALKVLGLDLGWVPGLPNSVANEINGSDYLKVGAAGVLQLIRDKLGAIPTGPLDGVLGPLVGGVLTTLGLPSLSSLLGLVDNLIASANPITGALPDLIDVRITPTVGIGVGAFAAAMAYRQVIDDLKNQPGGSAHPGATGELNPLLGSLTLLPMVLINNPGRPDGGAAARFGALAALLGIDAVNPHTQLTGEGGILDTSLGLHTGGANVLPVLIDATYEYQALSDLASWPNPFTLVNNLAAALSPTYMLRGLSLAGLTEQLTPQLAAAVADVTAGKPLALNLYLTLHSATLPMLEPLYLTSDFLNLVGLKPVADFVMHLANALSPALTTLTNIGYANAIQNADGTISRDFTTAGTETPFLSFANIDYGKALSDSFNQLLGGFQKEFLSGNPTPTGPNVLSNLINALLDGSLLGGTAGATTPGGATGATTTTNPLGGLLGGLLNGLGLGGLLPGLGLTSPTAPLAAPLSALAAQSDPSATGLPSPSARMLSIRSVENPTPATDEESKNASAAAVSTTVQPSTVVAETTPAADPQTPPSESPTPAAATDDSGTPDPTSAAGPKHAKPEGDSAPATGDQTTGPKHAKPDTDPGAPGDVAASDAGTKTPPKHAKPTTSEVRDTANDFSPKGDKSADKPGRTGDENGKAAGAGTAGSDAASSGGTSSDKAA